jgi:hypothetical protein
MMVLHATQEQYDILNGYEYGNSLLEFVKDADNKWITGLSVLNDSNFAEIHNQLEQLERIQYTPMPSPPLEN